MEQLVWFAMFTTCMIAGLLWRNWQDKSRRDFWAWQGYKKEKARTARFNQAESARSGS